MAFPDTNKGRDYTGIHRGRRNSSHWEGLVWFGFV